MDRDLFIERRRHIRSKGVFYAALTPYSGKPTEYEGSTCNISEVGLKIKTDTAIFPGNTALVRISLPGCENKISSPAIVIWARINRGVFEAGIRFTQLTDDEKGALRKHIKRDDANAA